MQLLIRILSTLCLLFAVQSAENRTKTSGDTVSVNLEIFADSASSLKPPVADPPPVAVTPLLSFESAGDPLSFSQLYQKHRLTFPIAVTLLSTNELNQSISENCSLVGIQVAIDNVLIDAADSSIRALAKISRKPNAAVLVILCDTFIRCQQIKESIQSDAEEFWQSMTLSIEIKLNDRLIRFDNLLTANLPVLSANTSKWTVFQRRIDGTLSFAKDWRAYVNGFGSPDSNYWMGLDRLFQMTVISKRNSFYETARCRLRVQVTDFNNTSYWGEYANFQVLDEGHRYRLRLGQAVAGSQLGDFAEQHSDLEFSTYDRKHDRLTGDSCSQLYGYGGWWFGSCHHVNLNGAYLTDPSITNSPVYASFRYSKMFIPIKRSEMKFKC